MAVGLQSQGVYLGVETSNSCNLSYSGTAPVEDIPELMMGHPLDVPLQNWSESIFTYLQNGVLYLYTFILYNFFPFSPPNKL